MFLAYCKYLANKLLVRRYRFYAINFCDKYNLKFVGDKGGKNINLGLRLRSDTEEGVSLHGAFLISFQFMV